MYEFLRYDTLKNPNMRQNLLNMNVQAKEFNDGHEHAGSFIFIFNPQSRKVLVGRRSPYAEFEPNRWNPFGGTMEINECPILTAMREVYEEGNISPNQYKINPTMMYMDENTDKYGNNHRVYLYMGIVDEEFEPTIDDEHTDAKWIHISELPKLHLFSPLKNALLNPDALNILKETMVNTLDK
jgi:8-oxo-dGTP pyrophosphatase MutT (NUDIX family)